MQDYIRLTSYVSSMYATSIWRNKLGQKLLKKTENISENVPENQTGNFKYKKFYCKSCILTPSYPSYFKTS